MDASIVRRLFEDSQAELQGLLAGVDSLELLARAGLSRLFADARGDQPTRGPRLEVFHLELLQAFSLAATRAIPDGKADYPVATQSILRLIEQHADAYRKLWRVGLSDNVEANQRLEVLAQVRGWTLAVRGPRHPHQTLAYLEAMAGRVDASFRHHFGCGASDALAMLRRVETVLEARLRAELAWRRRWFRDRASRSTRVDVFVEGLQVDEADRVRRHVDDHDLDRGALRAFLWNEAERRLVNFFTLSADDLIAEHGAPTAAALRGLLRRLSLGFGDVDPDEIEHVHLANPVRLKPFIRLADDLYGCPNPQSLLTGLAEVFEGLCGDAPSLKAKWEAARSEWLEAQLKAVVATHFPDAEVRSKVQWTDPANGKGWESDVVAVLDKTVLIFEAKSGKLNAATRRGAPGSLKSDLKALVVEPSEQSARLKAFLEGGTETKTFETAEGAWTIDVTDLRSVPRVNILVDTVGALSAHWPLMKRAGLVPADADIAPTMSIFELETVLEVLSLQIERCHYLARRAELEANAQYTADELDLLAFYVGGQFNIGEAEFDGTPLHLYGLSHEISGPYSQYFVSGKPEFRIRRSHLVGDVLQLLESTRHAGWTRFGHRLLSLTLPQQKQLERLVRAGWQGVSRAPDHFFTSGITAGPQARLQTVQIAIGSVDDQEGFERILRVATTSGLEQSGLDDLLLIVWFVPRTATAYDFIGVMRRLQGAGPYSALPRPEAS